MVLMSWIYTWSAEDYRMMDPSIGVILPALSITIIGTRFIYSLHRHAALYT